MDLFIDEQVNYQNPIVIPMASPQHQGTHHPFPGPPCGTPGLATEHHAAVAVVPVDETWPMGKT